MGTDEKVRAFFLKNHIREADISYTSAEMSLFGKNILLYRPSFPKLLFPLKSDKMKLSMDGKHVAVQLDGVFINVMDVLRIIHAHKIKNILAVYHPYRDAFAYPFESLALAGAEKIKMDVNFTIIPGPKQTVVQGELIDKKLIKCAFKLIFDNENQASQEGFSLDAASFDLFAFVSYPIREIQLEVTDYGLLSGYISYAQKLGVEPPVTLTKTLIKGQSSAFFIDDVNMPLKQIFQ
jgi:hypothetical protein